MKNKLKVTNKSSNSGSVDYLKPKRKMSTGVLIMGNYGTAGRKSSSSDTSNYSFSQSEVGFDQRFMTGVEIESLEKKVQIYKNNNKKYIHAPAPILTRS